MDAKKSPNNYRAVTMDSPGQEKEVHMGLPLTHVLQNSIISEIKKNLYRDGADMPIRLTHKS